MSDGVMTWSERLALRGRNVGPNAGDLRYGSVSRSSDIAR